MTRATKTESSNNSKNVKQRPQPTANHVTKNSMHDSSLQNPARHNNALPTTLRSCVRPLGTLDHGRAMEAKPEGSPRRVGRGISSSKGAAKKEVHTSIAGSLDEPSCTANREVQPHSSPTIQYSEWLPTRGQLSRLSCREDEWLTESAWHHDVFRQRRRCTEDHPASIPITTSPTYRASIKSNTIANKPGKNRPSTTSLLDQWFPAGIGT